MALILCNCLMKVYFEYHMKRMYSFGKTLCSPRKEGVVENIRGVPIIDNTLELEREFIQLARSAGKSLTLYRSTRLPTSMCSLA